MATNITETAISSAANRAKEGKVRVELVDKELQGLRLRITPPGKRNSKGVKSWSLVCRDHEGRIRRFPLGYHPNVGVSAARDLARALRPGVREPDAEKRIDPIAAGRRQRAIGRDARDGIGTLQSLIDLYGKKVGVDLKSWAECRRRIEDVFRPFLVKPIANMKAGDLQLQADSWPSGQSAAAAVRYLRPIMKWASEGSRGYAARELAMLTPPATVARRERVLSRDELSRVLPVLKSSSKPYASCLRFLLLTLARREEACSAKWRDVDFTAKTWTIGETKNGQPHIVPLSSQAIELLKSLFPRKKDGEKVDPKPADRIFCTGTGEALGNWDRETKKFHVTSKTKGWTRHDLRRTGATMLGNMGHPPHVVEAALNHVSLHSRLAANYNQARYRPEVEAALQRLADALDGIEVDAAKVFTFPEGRAA